LATVVLCTWSTIHPNLPGMNDGNWRKIRRRIGYVLGTLVAPEYFAWYALEEMRQAMKMKPKVNQASHPRLKYSMC
jgi:hypothetical protein